MPEEQPVIRTADAAGFAAARPPTLPIERSPKTAAGPPTASAVAMIVADILMTQQESLTRLTPYDASTPRWLVGRRWSATGRAHRGVRDTRYSTFHGDVSKEKICNRALHLVLGSERLVYLYYRRAIANPHR